MFRTINALVCTWRVLHAINATVPLRAAGNIALYKHVFETRFKYLLKFLRVMVTYLQKFTLGLYDYKTIGNLLRRHYIDEIWI